MLSKNKSFQVASYLRLSREDGDKAESDSIVNQRAMIAEFVKQHDDLNFKQEYIDDGYSGTNFIRPAFQKMIEDVKKRRIDCIVVKDLSRFGRNYIETGRYLEKIFPMLGVRFIAINDHYDNAEESNDADQIIVPFKNLINDAYCRDLSVKVRSNLDIKRKKGKFIGSFACYGYLKDPEDKNHLVIDEYAAEIVLLIFKMKIDGFSAERIAEKLDEMKVLTPMEYKRMCGLNFNSGFRCGKNPKWSVTTVLRILKNEMYTGMMVQGKNQKINYKIKQIRAVEEKDWIRVDKTHEAVIQPEVFECVQELLKIDTRTAPSHESVYLFSGFLKCADCGQNMVRRSGKKKEKMYYYYHCSTYKNGDGCSSHNISEKKLSETVLEAVRKQIELLADVEAVISRYDELPKERFSVKILDKQIAASVAEAERYKDLKVKLYQDMQDGVIGREEFVEINKRFSDKFEQAETACTSLEDRRKKLLSNHSRTQPWMQEFLSYRNITELNRKILVTLIKQIVVHSKNQIEIHFNYKDEMLELLDIATQCKESEQGKVAVV